MEISGQGVPGQIQGTNHYIENGEGVAGKQQAQGTAGAEAKNLLLNSLEPGNYVYGQVQSSSEDGAVLLLENGQKLLAKLAEGVTLVPGQNVTFQVEKKQDGLVYMKPLFAEAALEMTAQKALQGAGLMGTLKNLEIVKSLLELNMPVDGSTIRSMLQKSVTNPDVPVKQLALLEKLGIPVTKENVEQLKQYQASEHQIGKQMDQLLKELGGKTEQLLMEGKTGEAAELNQKVLDFLYEELTEQGQNEENGSIRQEGPEEAAVRNLAEEIGPEGEMTPTEEMKPTEEMTAGKGTVLAGEMVLEGGEEAAKEAVLGETGKPAEEAIIREGKEILGKEILGKEMLPETGKGIIETHPESAENSVQEHPASETAVNAYSLKDGLEGSGSFGQKEFPFKMEYPQDRPEGVPSGQETVPSGQETVSIKEQMFELKTLLAQTKNPEELKKLLSSTKFQTILEKGMKEAWQIKPSEFNGKDSINRSYARVEEQTRLLGELLKESSAEGGSSLKSVINVQQNLEFMQDINQVFPYIQLPLQMAGESAHGDLYVFKDKKKQHEAGEPFTAFLHLSMEHLGDVNVYLSLMEQKVSTDIIVGQESILDLFEAHMDEFIGRLKKKGYEVSTSLKIGDREPDFAEDILAKQAGGNTVNRYSFDVKA